jgi:hypothetical protein
MSLLAPKLKGFSEGDLGPRLIFFEISSCHNFAAAAAKSAEGRTAKIAPQVAA